MQIDLNPDQCIQIIVESIETIQKLNDKKMANYVTFSKFKKYFEN